MFNSLPLFIRVSFPDYVDADQESVGRSGIRCPAPILPRLVLRGYYSRTIGSPLLPIRLSRHPQLLDDLESFRRESARRRATGGRIPKLEISSPSLIPERQFFRQTKTLMTQNLHFGIFAKICPRTMTRRVMNGRTFSRK